MRPVQPSKLGDALGVVKLSPSFIWGTHSHALAFNSGFLAKICFFFLLDGGLKPPSMGGEVASSGGWEYFASGRQTDIIIPPDTGVLTCFTPPFHLALPTMTQFGEWSYTLEVHYLPASMGLDIIPSTSHTCSFQGPWPHHLT